jgi:hypothetical protein
VNDGFLEDHGWLATTTPEGVLVPMLEDWGELVVIELLLEAGDVVLQVQDRLVLVIHEVSMHVLEFVLHLDQLSLKLVDLDGMNFSDMVSLPLIVFKLLRDLGKASS